jgi:hypothetical protein
MCEYECIQQGNYCEPQMREATLLMADALCSLCTKSSRAKDSAGRDIRVTSREVINQLNQRCIERDSDGVYIGAFLDFAAHEYLDAVQERIQHGDQPLRNPLQYAKRIMWTAINRYEQPKDDDFDYWGVMEC